MGRPANSVDRMLIGDVEQTDACWLWKGARSANGYGKTTILGRSCLPHRLFYEHYKGAIPEGHQVDHLCRNRRCVNPAHLEAVTPQENTLRSEGVAAKNAQKTHCVSGHRLSGVNLYVTPDGRRQCRTCRRNAVAKCNNMIGVRLADRACL